MSNLTFWEVVDCVLQENWCASECSLNYLLAHRAHTHLELDDLTKAHGESNKSSLKRIKKEIDLRCKDLESLREHISYYELHLRQDPLEDNTPDDDGLFSHGAQARMATAPGVNDAPSESAMTQASDPPPTEGQTHAMEVGDEGTHSHPASPISTAEDDLLMGGGAIGVESDLAHLTVLSPRSPNGKGEEASTWEALPSLASGRSGGSLCGCLQDSFKEETRPSYWMKGDVFSQLQVKTPERPFFEAYCINSFHNVFKL